MEGFAIFISLKASIQVTVPLSSDIKLNWEKNIWPYKAILLQATIAQDYGPNVKWRALHDASMIVDNEIQQKVIP